MNRVLEIENVSKSYTPFSMKATFDKNYRESVKNDAVKNVSFHIDEGEIYGLLGPNGAGKSTIIKMISGLIRKDAGKIVVNGYDIDTDRQRASAEIGAIIETPNMFRNMSAIDNLRYFGDLEGGVSDERIMASLDIVGLSSRARDKVATYSLGMKQRLGIAQAIMGKHKLLVLDEPTNGLDPQWIISMRELIRRLAHEYKMSVLVCSHILAEMQELCDVVGIINNGTLVKEIAVDELDKINVENATIACYTTADAVGTYNSIAARYNKVTIKNGKVFVEIMEKDIPNLTRDLVNDGIDIYEIAVKKATLEDLFRALVSDENASNDGEGGSDNVR